MKSSPEECTFSSVIGFNTSLPMACRCAWLCKLLPSMPRKQVNLEVFVDEYILFLAEALAQKEATRRRLRFNGSHLGRQLRKIMMNADGNPRGAGHGAFPGKP